VANLISLFLGGWMANVGGKWIDERIDKRLVKTLLDFLVLQKISAEPCHGYKLIRQFRKQFGFYFGPSTIYPLLTKLEKRGYVKSEYVVATKPRKVYSITTEGEKHLEKCNELLGSLMKCSPEIKIVLHHKAIVH